MAKKTAAATPAPAAQDKPIEAPVDLFKADPDNARTIEAPALRGLGVSMTTFGDLSGIVWNERTGELVAGHQRVNRLRAVGAVSWLRVSKTEGYIDHPKTGERFHVRIVDWDETMQRMANLTANNPHIQGDFTPEAFEQIEALEDEAAFEVLQLGELEKDLEKLVDQMEEEGADGEGGDGGGKGKVPNEAFAILVPCDGEKHQRELLGRFASEGLRPRALVGSWSLDSYQARPAAADAEAN